MILSVLFAILSLTANVNSQTIVSNYAGALDTSDGVYTRPGGSGTYYYEAIQIVVDTTGNYDLSSFATNNMDTHGYLYNDAFDPLNPSLNLIQEDDDSAGNTQFRLLAALQAGVPYTLVVTSHTPSVTGSYSVTASGPGNAQMTQIDPFYLTTTPPTTTLPSVVTTSYSNSVTEYGGNYTRYGVPSGTFYYHTVQVRVLTTGTYTFSTSSSISDTYGYLYQGNFYPNYPEYNIVIQDDDSSGSNQFGLTADLRPDLTYILVFTTFTPLVTGSFDISVSGPDNVFMNPI